MKKSLALFLFFPLSFCLVSCSKRERSTSVIVDAGPSFTFAGSGRLGSFRVYAPPIGQRIALPDSDVASVRWQVKTSKGYFNGIEVEGFRLSYGSVPQGYTQVVPNQQQIAASLPPGAVYSFLA